MGSINDFEKTYFFRFSIISSLQFTAGHRLDQFRTHHSGILLFASSRHRQSSHYTNMPLILFAMTLIRDSNLRQVFRFVIDFMPQTTVTVSIFFY